MLQYNYQLLFATNDNRSRHLEKELAGQVQRLYSISYDPVPLMHKYIAALLTYNRNRMIWWNKFQWHRIIQLGRRGRLIRSISKLDPGPDALLMWGSWFNPFAGTPYSGIPYYLYIDQSCNKAADEFDISSRELEKPRLRFNAYQYETYKNSEAIFCMSEWARRQTLEAHANIPEEKIIKVGWGPIGLNLMNEEITYNKNEKNILFVGHQFYRKGVDFLRSAIPIVVKKFPDVKFKVVGSNSDHLKLEPHPNLELLGSVTDIDKMKELYRNAFVFVLPHRFDRSPHVLIEAMSAGKPIITSRQGGAPEVVRHGKTGFLIDIGDVEALAEYITILLKNTELRSTFGEEGRKVMVAEYTWESIASRMLKIMNERLKKASSPERLK